MVFLEGLGSSLPAAEPHLMPFHIDYNGPAPLSSYFLVRPCPDEAASKSLKSRFISAFRGRKLQGLKVNVPEGYVGVVFSPKNNGKDTKTSHKTRGKKGPTLTRPSDDIAMDDAGDLETVKTFAASGVFSSFTLWSPDVNVDEGEDEYIRTLSEYRNLLAEIHRTDV